jgi:Fe2+ or Zn2+ uptake regulation protein
VRSPQELAEVFRANGRKVTPQRQCIFRIIQGDTSHPSAEAVYTAARSEMETISLKTVYQTLNDLAEMGEVLPLDLGTGTMRFDPNVESPHHHLVCRGCGKVADLDADYSQLEVPSGADHGFLLGSAEVVFRGYCDVCRIELAACTQPEPTPTDQAAK